MLEDKRKVCFVITSMVHYGRSKLILKEIQKKDNLELQIIVGASAILSKYGNVLEELEKDGLSYHAKITMTLEGGTPVAMAKTTGLGISEFSTVFDNLNPDIVLVRGDRYEVLAATIAAAYLNITVAHIEGGDVTGTIDESVRHAITKLAHIHFATHEDAKQRILKMGENPDYVFNVGCPGLEFIAKNKFDLVNDFVNHSGVGDILNINQPYIVVMQHPVTTEMSKNRQYINETLEAVHDLNIPTIWFWPNVDAGTDEISKGIRIFREKYDPKNIRFFKYLPPEQFISLINKCVCFVGNSSAGIKETSFLGIPVVNIGTRQTGRKRANNVFDVAYDKGQIGEAIQKQIVHGRYPASMIYFKEDTSKQIVDILSSINLYTQKKFFD